MSSDITRDDLCYVKPPSPEDFGSHYSRTRKVTDEEFDRLAREWMHKKGNMDDLVAGTARQWIAEHPGKALRVLFTDECDNCAGYGNLHGGDCPKCGGRGWLPKDGVTIHRNASTGYETAMFPADWLEADHE